MSRAGTPTDKGFAERFVGVFKLSLAERRTYHTLGEFLRAAEAWINFYNQERPHEGLNNLSPLQLLSNMSWRIFLNQGSLLNFLKTLAVLKRILLK